MVGNQSLNHLARLVYLQLEHHMLIGLVTHLNKSFHCQLWIMFIQNQGFNHQVYQLI